MQVHPKVAAAALAGALVVIGDWALRTFAHVNQPPEVVASETVIVSFVVGWFVPGTTS